MRSATAPGSRSAPCAQVRELVAAGQAASIFVAQKRSRLVETMMSTVGEMPIHELTVIDRELANNGSNRAVEAAVTSEQLKQPLGIDLAATLQGIAGHRAPTPQIPSPPPRPRPPTLPRSRP